MVNIIWYEQQIRSYQDKLHRLQDDKIFNHTKQFWKNKLSDYKII